MQVNVFGAGKNDVARSGLTGPPDLPDSAGRPRRSGLRRSVAAGVRGLVVGIPSVLATAYRAGPGLTVLLAVATAVTGFVPALTAGNARLITNAVVRSVIGSREHRAVVVTLGYPVPGLGHAGPTVTVTTAVLVLVVLQVLILSVAAGATAVTNAANQLLQERLTQAVQLRVMEKAGGLDLSFFEDSRSYDQLARAQKEAAARPMSMITTLFTSLQSIITLLSLVVLLIGLSPWLAVAMFVAPVPAFIADTRYGVRTFYLELWAAPIKRRMDYLSSLLTTDGAAKEIRVFGTAAFLRTRYQLLGSTFYQRMRHLTIARYARGGSWGLLSTLVGGIAFAYVVLGAVGGRLSIGDLALYTAAVTSVQASIQMIFKNLSTIHENVLYMTELDQLLAREPTITAPPDPRILQEPVAGSIIFDEVTFTYPGSKRPALDRVSLRIEPGQTVAIVGENGAGKSTLVKLLCRLYDPDAGRILCDNVDLRDIDPAHYREHVSAIFQDHCLYQATAAENIGLGAVAHIEDRPRVERAARAAGVDSLIESLPDGYDTPLGKWFARGAQLSGGQWQKVALARAFMRDAPVLALDEPTAALDARAEHELFLRLGELARGRTTLYISHRFSTVRRADRIIVLDQGRMVEDGTHQELLALEGRYAELYRLQAAAYAGDPDGMAVQGAHSG